jgi:hypothetical protein
MEAIRAGDRVLRFGDLVQTMAPSIPGIPFKQQYNIEKYIDKANKPSSPDRLDCTATQLNK